MKHYKKTLVLCALLCAAMQLHAAPTDGSLTASPVPIPASVRESFHQKETAPHVLADPDYFCWGMTTLRWSDGKIHGYYARWPRSRGFAGWMTHCEIAHAVADRPEGPFKTLGAVIESRHMKGWDVVNAHNPSVCVAEGKIHLYYISNNLRGEFEKEESGSYPSDDWLKKNRREIVRNRQCIGVASADSPDGPFVRSPDPVVVPHGRFKNIAVNPAVIYRDGRFVMIAKGDDIRRNGWFRIQMVGHSDHAAGPFVFQKQPIYDKAQTEDACIWFDQTEKLYHSVFHVMGKPTLAHLVSEDSMVWREAEPFTFMPKQFELSDGSIWKPARVERPFVLTDDQGRAEWIYLAVAGKGGSGNMAVPLRAPGKPVAVLAPQDYMQLRGGLPKSAERFSGGQGHVVFMGGSITHMGARNKPGWSRLVRADLQRRFPECKFQFENVGIPSIGTMGHAHRFERDVLGRGTPDLLVIEAAVNDLHIGRTAEEARQGMEGVVRSARELGIEVLMLHFADGPHLTAYAKAEVPMVIAEHEAVAQYYAVPSINMALHVQQQIAEGNMDWKRDFKANCHVPAFGQKLYAEQIGKLLDAAWADGTALSGQRQPRKPLDPANWIHGRLLPMTAASALNHTQIIDHWKPADKARTREGFVNIPVLEARGAASSFAVAFEGTGIGLWTISGPDAGRIRWRVDGSAWQEVETFTRHSHHLHLPNPMLLARNLKFGAHQLEVEVQARPEGQRGGEVLRVVHVLVHGASLNKTQEVLADQ